MIPLYYMVPSSVSAGSMESHHHHQAQAPPAGAAAPDAFASAKNDLIAELKLSQNVGGISRLRREQARAQERQEEDRFKRFLAQFTMENYLDKVSERAKRETETDVAAAGSSSSIPNATHSFIVDL